MFSGALERDFIEDARAFRGKRQWLESFISIALYTVFAVLSLVAAPEGHSLESRLRFELVIPLLLLLNLAFWFRFATWLRDMATLITSGIAGSVEILTHLSPHDGSRYVAHLAVIVVLIFTNTVMRLRPFYAVGALVWAIGVECVLIALQPPNTLSSGIFRAALVLTVGFLTVIASYSQDREARLAFLRLVQKEQMVGDLALSNQELVTAASTDGLTGLANRSSLDKRLAEMWAEPLLSMQECSIIMADIDHFKSINDRYGHLYGDRVIRRVGHLMSEALRGEDDFIARYGGEEFVVILPHTSLQQALAVAERLRGLIELAGLPSLRTEDPDLEGMRATISCGVATGLPRLLSEPDALIGGADLGLYRAKREGRNVVRESPSPT
ncbi:diguanylate cyclase (GGDEF) domain-containing protein [Terriglobus roseus]|uniref:diguanylate cyclase n=2 Tax=Terriglobus roseus TaxID=392734 RepID=A0A1H4K3M9_9BACT|nr:diguanylate cyclase (GGDEF) domain-containing protein [Terriglobus roseus]